MLSQVTTPTVARPEQRRVRGYMGPRKSIAITDDDPGHRDLVSGLLEPIGFHVLCASNAQQCLELASAMPVDLFLLDVNMPGTNGWELARLLRGTDHADRPIVMVSADAYESQRAQGGQSCHDDFVVKPVDFWQLLEKIRQHMQIEWLYDEAPAPPAPAVLPADASASAEVLDALWSLGQMGHVRGIHYKLDEMDQADVHTRALSAHLRTLVKAFQLNRYMKVLEALRADAR